MFGRGIFTNNVVWGLFAYNPTFSIMKIENFNHPIFSRLFTERSRDGWSGLVSTVEEPGAHWTHEEGEATTAGGTSAIISLVLPSLSTLPPSAHPVHQDACVLALEHFDPGHGVETPGPPPPSQLAGLPLPPRSASPASSPPLSHFPRMHFILAQYCWQ